MWINPVATNFGAAMEPSTALITTNGPDLTANQIASFVFLQRSVNEPPAMLADELRIGSMWASVTPLPAPILITLTGAMRMGNGAFQFGYTNSSAQNGSIYASTNLINWTSIGPATQISPGLYQFIDITATNYPHRYYQLRSP